MLTVPPTNIPIPNKKENFLLNAYTVKKGTEVDLITIIHAKNAPLFNHKIDFRLPKYPPIYRKVYWVLLMN